MPLGKFDGIDIAALVLSEHWRMLFACQIRHFAHPAASGGTLADLFLSEDCLSIASPEHFFPSGITVVRTKSIVISLFLPESSKL